METSDLINLIQLMLKETTTTLGIFFVTFAASVVLGILLAIGRKNRLKIVSMPIGAFLLLMRGTPLILQLMVFYFAPYYVFHATLPRFWAAVLAFSLNYSAYTCEIFRAGIDSIPVGQYEAASILGFSKTETFMKIILPQVVKRIVPPYTNELMTLVKDTSLAQTIGVAELFKVACTQMTHFFSTVPLIVAGVFYLIMNCIIGKAANIIEKKLDYYK